jgi:hypothetical protein
MKVRATGRRRDVPPQPRQSTETTPAHDGTPTEAVIDAAEYLSPAVREGARPAFYALQHGGWRDYITLLHPPYTFWHLSYVILGAALSPAVRYDRLAATLLAFFLAVGVAAHALDELNGRPLQTRIPRFALAALGIGGLVGAILIGIAGAVLASPWLLVFVAFGAFIAPAYNLEWLRARFHSDFWFAIAWGVFPFLTAYYASAGRFEPSALFGAVAVFASSLAQRVLSRRVRAVRRQVRSIEGRVVYADGTMEDIGRAWALAADERALLLLACAMPGLSLAALLARV